MIGQEAQKFLSAETIEIFFRKFLSPRNSPFLLHQQYCKTISELGLCRMKTATAMPPSVSLKKKKKNFPPCLSQTFILTTNAICLCFFMSPAAACFCCFFLWSWLWNKIPWLYIFSLPHTSQASSVPTIRLTDTGVYFFLHIFSLSLHYKDVCILIMNGVLSISSRLFNWE